jgi:hypothetical protein
VSANSTICAQDSHKETSFLAARKGNLADFVCGFRGGTMPNKSLTPSNGNLS